jgi:hypothetical protein
LKEQIKDFSEAILINLMGELILTEKYKLQWSDVNGVSFSPKKNFCIVKIWMKCKSLDEKNMFNIPKSYKGDIIYKENNM